LPDGVRFDPNEFPENNNFVTIANSRVGTAGQNLPVAFPFRGASLDLTSTSEVRAQIFQPDGTLSGQKFLRLRLVEAAEDVGGSGITYIGRQVAGQPANYYDIVILRETGQAKVERL
jgi:hypothetical protein